MIEDYVDTIGALYTSALNSTGEERDRRIYDLTVYLRENRQRLAHDPLTDPSRPISYRALSHLRGSEDVSFHLQHRVELIESIQVNTQFGTRIMEASDSFEPYYQWLNAHQSTVHLNAQSSVEDVLNAVDEVRSKKLHNGFLEMKLSNFVVNRFKLEQFWMNLNSKLNEITKSRDHQIRLIAHLGTIYKDVESYLTWLDQDELKKVASHFYFVPMFSKEIPEEWYKRFLKLCVNARIVDIKVPITSLSSDDLPPHLEQLGLLKCEFDRVSLSLPKLKKFTVTATQTLSGLELNAPYLTDLDIEVCEHLETLHLNTPNLERLSLNKNCVQTLTLDTPFLYELLITNIRTLRAINLVHSDRLRTVSFDGCTTLRSILEPGRALPNCRTLNVHNCPAAIPQVPTTVEVFRGWVSNRVSILSFRVNPKLLEENPLQVLLDFGVFMQSRTYFPNIVWINPLTGAEVNGADAGGLRRHFVAALTENLPLSLLKDKLALETYGRLIGFAAESSLLLGSSLSTEFFYELLSEVGSREITNGVRASLGPHWEKWKKKPEESDANFTHRVRLFADQVQGKPVTVDNLFTLLQFEGGDIVKTKEYFRRFFSEFPLLVDERVFQLKHFHQLMLGSLSLEGRPITINVKEPGEAVPSIHACSGEMEIPIYLDYQTFKNKLTWAFRAHDTFETI